MLDNVRIVLINTFHPGNLGATARAMKNMGLSDLWLVDPCDDPEQEALPRAAGAKDVYENATRVSTLEEAIADCELVIGTSARTRTFDLPLIDAREAGELTVSHCKNNAKVAIVFGRETMGLHNSELKQCNYHVYINANPDYPVMNVAQAVQVLCYEVWMAAQAATQATPKSTAADAPYPRQKELWLFYEHLEQVLRKTGFIIEKHEGKVLDKLQRYFNRSRPEKTELNMLRGILSSVDDSLDKK
ncbi:MAG: tRNA (cytosine(32)/uridine(32)-2'-O)-methyltransferase TrmJ [Pontibacterium sp.]